MAGQAGGLAGVLAGAGAVAVIAAAVIWSMQKAPDPHTAAAKDTATTAAAPEAPAAPETQAAVPPEPPRFDVVRVDGNGLATVAGSADPRAVVSLRVDGVEVAQATADAGGQFAALVTLTPSDAPRVLSLVAILQGGTEVAGVETVALAPVKAPVADPSAAESAASAAATQSPSESAPAALLISPEGVQVLQPPTPLDPPANLVDLRIDSITYGAKGEVVVGGHGSPAAAVRLYLNDQPVGDVTANGQGDWRLVLAEVAEGLHVLRADQIDRAGKVLARFETPFQREAVARLVAAEPAPALEATVSATEPAAQTSATQTPTAPAPDAAPVAAPAPITITVQPGLTLWAIARENFGDGVMYVQVFEANRDKIKDPDLIYPGQVFTVPKP